MLPPLFDGLTNHDQAALGAGDRAPHQQQVPLGVHPNHLQVLDGDPLVAHMAGQVLGLTKVQVFFKVVLFQVIKRIVPAMGNEIITLVKDTSLARIVGVMEIIMCAERFTKQGLIWPLFSTGLFFLAFCGALTLLFGFIEKKLNYYRG